MRLLSINDREKMIIQNTDWSQILAIIYSVSEVKALT